MSELKAIAKKHSGRGVGYVVAPGAGRAAWVRRDEEYAPSHEHYFASRDEAADYIRANAPADEV